MLEVARKNVIREQLRQSGSVQITALSEQLGVTKETIRRDLRAMEENGELTRTHGGAYIIDGVHNDIDISTRQFIRTDEKEIVARKCSSLINNGDYIYLDASTTAFFIAKAVMHRKITVLTTSLEIINLLSTSDVKLFVVGGEYNKATNSFTGASAIQNLKQYHFDKSFISSRSVSMDAGLTDTNDGDAMLHQIALDHAYEKYLAIDNTKLNRYSFSCVAPVSSLTGIIMDCDFPEDWVKFLNGAGVKYF